MLIGSTPLPYSKLLRSANNPITRDQKAKIWKSEILLLYYKPNCYPALEMGETMTAMGQLGEVSIPTTHLGLVSPLPEESVHIFRL